ncbi:hypothetical protein ACQUQU_07310 [Thalassolituus sp. LLYu03]|uniref:hypothetical protein n=1 Tax=Thalassolituus sp. LLYu03 TaxID=3421656 RepID=UPI003D29A95D
MTQVQAQSANLLPGQVVEDFTLPSAVGSWGQRLAEQKGRPVMLIWTNRCNRCEESLAHYQLLAESHAIDGLVSWVIWTPYKEDVPPRMRLPVLENNGRWQTAWQFEPRPAVMLISADGVLDYLFTGNLQRRFSDVEQVMASWVSTQLVSQP